MPRIILSTTDELEGQYVCKCVGGEERPSVAHFYLALVRISHSFYPLRYKSHVIYHTIHPLKVYVQATQEGG